MSQYFTMIKPQQLKLFFSSLAVVISFFLVVVTAPNLVAKEKKISSIDKAVQEVRSLTKGKIISAETVMVEEELKHRIKVLLENGHVKVFYKPLK